VAALRNACGGWLDLDGVAEAVVVSDHLLDALLSALVAVAVTQGATLGPRDDEERRLAAIEGWIHVPVVALGEAPKHRVIDS
jgi:hypothetical protein